MFKKLVPNQSHKSIYDIDLHNLYKMGYENLLIDIDNTITPWNSNEVSKKLEEWFEKCRSIGFLVYLFSNNKPKRVNKISKKLGVKAIPTGGKPFAFAFRRALKHIKGAPENTVMIGDQIFTDILGGNLIKLYTILVEPISTDEFWGTKLHRILERIVTGRRY